MMKVFGDLAINAQCVLAVAVAPADNEALIGQGVAEIGVIFMPELPRLYVSADSARKLITFLEENPTGGAQ